MKMLNNVINTILLALFGMVTVNTAIANDCVKYAYDAVEQNSLNLWMNCNYSGPRWQANLLNHYDWCMSAPSQSVLSESDIRNSVINKCRESFSNQYCYKYALTSVKENDQNIKNQCDFIGPGWHFNFLLHYQWCNNVNDSLSSSEAETRKSKLMKCGTLAKKDIIIQTNTNRFGMDYKSIDLQDGDFNSCKEFCINDEKCYAFTYVKPGVQAVYAKCWLKDLIPNSNKDPNTISGYKVLIPEIKNVYVEKGILTINAIHLSRDKHNTKVLMNNNKVKEELEIISINKDIIKFEVPHNLLGQEYDMRLHIREVGDSASMHVMLPKNLSISNANLDPKIEFNDYKLVEKLGRTIKRDEEYLSSNSVSEPEEFLKKIESYKINYIFDNESINILSGKSWDIKLPKSNTYSTILFKILYFSEKPEGFRVELMNVNGARKEYKGVSQYPPSGFFSGNVDIPSEWKDSNELLLRIFNNQNESMSVNAVIGTLDRGAD